jgi:hypothetical protein
MLIEFRVLVVPSRGAPQLLGFTEARLSGDVSGIPRSPVLIRYQVSTVVPLRCYQYK